MHNAIDSSMRSYVYHITSAPQATVATLATSSQLAGNAEPQQLEEEGQNQDGHGDMDGSPMEEDELDNLLEDAARILQGSLIASDEDDQNSWRPPKSKGKGKEVDVTSATDSRESSPAQKFGSVNNGNWNDRVEDLFARGHYAKAAAIIDYFEKHGSRNRDTPNGETPVASGSGLARSRPYSLIKDEVSCNSESLGSVPLAKRNRVEILSPRDSHRHQGNQVTYSARPTANV
ncbi:uncharacterized protein MELLADRAFT_103663 [Melampsora larici-populina 98AG31]|uniref:Uncharacterized protein n=1 Tax=Melampsora larici-populina (strain 98AG31 / pathotype 3-4-7) TaxID=747676 RepID=F4RC26_MELLP|nr:uncharacterized protein MELLADRAFT_103663 [Melampsora larici-populina 98AG31]EGG10235.1 hypothetical protein MELLADRAFT_103663 [Melampsora larici-populina 98AG31]